MKKSTYISLALCVLWLGIISAYERELEKTRVYFHQSMENIAADASRFASTRTQWNFAETLYQKYVMQELDYSESVRIPLIVHHVWIGSPLPEYVKRFRTTWLEHCEDWTFILWTDHPSLEYGDVILKNLEELQDYLKNEDHAKRIIMDMNYVQLYNQVALVSRARNYGEKSDLIRYEALYQVGGLYVDTDFECLKSFEDLHYALDFYLGIAYDHNFSLLTGIMGAKAGDPVLAEAISRLHNRRQTNDSMTYAGPHFLTQVFLDVLAQHSYRAVAFPLTYFYPMPAVARDSATPWLKPESYAVHHWKMSWM